MSLSKPFYQNSGHIKLRLMLHPIVSVSFHIVTENYGQLWVLSSMTTRVLPLPVVLTSTWDRPARPRVDTWQLTNENHSEINLVVIFIATHYLKQWYIIIQSGNSWWAVTAVWAMCGKISDYFYFRFFLHLTKMSMRFYFQVCSQFSIPLQHLTMLNVKRTSKQTGL